MSAAHSPHLALHTVLKKEDRSEVQNSTKSEPGQWKLPNPDLPLEKATALFEEKYIQSVIENCGGQLQAAAKILGIHRSTLYRKQNKN